MIFISRERNGVNFVRKPFILIILVLCISLFQTGFAAASSEPSTYEDYAECLSDLGVFVGTGSGFELDRAPTRIEGLVMLTRLLGVEEEAKTMQGKTMPFTDVPKWATGYVAYAYENGLTNGVSKSKFGSSNHMEAKAFLTFLLRSLGYNDQAGDFSYNNALVFSKGIHLIDDKMYATLKSEPFLRAYVAKTAYDALKFPYKGGDVWLIDKLIAEDKIEKAIGATLEKIVLTEPADRGSVKTGVAALEDNLKSVVMLKCYGNHSDENDPAIGSGVILASDGRIVTNYHVIEGACNIEITFYDETVYQGDVYIEDYDKELDLAVLKINKSGLTPAIMGDSDEAKAGASVKTIGSPYGYLNTVTEGIISAIRRDSIQISAAVNPGNSGGGLFDQYGKLIAIPSSSVYLADNMGFAIPINKLSALSENQRILLSDFYVKNAKSLPPAPTGLSILYETKTTALLTWNPVVDADFYYIYYKTSEDEAYTYLDSVYDITSYGYLAVGMIPGDQYHFKVTAQRDEQESEMSAAVSFQKSYGDDKHGSFTLYYSEYPNIPDFGKLTGCIPYKKGTDQFSYRMKLGEIPEIVYTDYVYLLEDSGFAFVSATDNSDSSVVDIYKNESTNQTVTIRASLLSEEEYLVVIEIES